ncbi:MAG: class IV adenylate cyclase, partial [Bacteroidota bacterium]
QVPNGRLKLRQGNIEQNLIFYQRADQAGPKRSDVFLYKPNPDSDLKAVLAASLGIWKEVRKAREIFFIDNVKFHLDEVEGLGSFVEIEAIDKDGSRTEADLLAQCEHYMALFNIRESDLLENSYSDMVESGRFRKENLLHKCERRGQETPAPLFLHLGSLK